MSDYMPRILKQFGFTFTGRSIALAGSNMHCLCHVRFCLHRIRKFISKDLLFPSWTGRTANVIKKTANVHGKQTPSLLRPPPPSYGSPFSS